MSYVGWLAGALVVTGLSTDASALSREVPRSDRALSERSGVLAWRGAPFSGDVVEREGAALLSRTPYLGGLRHGVAEAFHPNGAIRSL
ncbi:MAG: hypothetical protein ACXVEE_40035 [Polyangiales bacterium]